MPSQNNSESLTLEQARVLLEKAGHEFSRVNALAWAVDQLFCENRDCTITRMEFESRIAYLVELIVEKTGKESDFFDDAAARVNSRAA